MFILIIIYFNSLYLISGARADPGPTLARPCWPRVELTPGQGHVRLAQPRRVRVRASKKCLALAWPGPWTVYTMEYDVVVQMSFNRLRKDRVGFGTCDERIWMWS